MAWMNRARGALDVLASVSIVVAAGAVTWSATVIARRDAARSVTRTPGVEDLSSQNLRLPMRDSEKPYHRGDVAFVEFADFECPYCGQHAREVLPTLRREFVETGRAKYIFRHLPLESIHVSARIAAATSECARVSGRFWQVHDWLFSGHDQLSPKRISTGGEAMGLTAACVAAADSIVTSDIATATRLKVASTPTFFVGTIMDGAEVWVRRRIDGAAPYDTLKTEITQMIDDSGRTLTQ